MRINAAPYSQHIAKSDRSSDVVNIKSSESDQFRFIAKTMKAVLNKEIKIHNLEQSVIQGFKVEGDSSNKIVFLDLEALRRTGIDLERVSIAAGTRSRSLKPIEGLKAKSSNFNSVVNEIRSDQDGKTEPQLRIPVYEQFAKVTEAENLPRIPSANIKDYQRTPLKPFIAVKHVVASQASRGYHQVPLDSRITAPTADATVIKPLANTEATKRQSLFFGKFQGRHEVFGIQDHRKHQEPVHQHVTSSTTVSPVTHGKCTINKNNCLDINIAGDDDFCVCLLPNQSCDICEVTCQADCNDLSREGGRCFSSLACDGTLQFELDIRSSGSSLWY